MGGIVEVPKDTWADDVSGFLSSRGLLRGSHFPFGRGPVSGLRPVRLAPDFPLQRSPPYPTEAVSPVGGLVK